MELIVVIPIIYLVAVLLAWFTKINIAYLFAPAIFVIAIWEFIFGLLGHLNLGMESLVLSLGLTLLFGTFKSARFRNFLLVSSYAPSTVAFVSLSLISLYKSKDWVLSLWDEFSHWGSFTKAMYEYAALAPATPVDLWHANYPPSISLFQYFVMDFSSEWREGLLFWSMHLIAISIIVSVLTSRSYRFKSEILFKLVIALVASSSFLNIFDTIYQDPLLALTFGFLIVVAIKASYLDGRWSIVFAITAGFVSLVKPVGIYFAAAAILINVFATLSTQRRTSGWKAALAFAPAVAALVTIGTTWTTWKFFCNRFTSEGAGISSTLPTSFNNMVNQDLVVANFANAFFNSNLRPTYAVPMNPLTWTIVCALFFATLALLQGRHKRKQNIVIGIALVITTAGYFGVILLAYLTVFVPGEAVGLASYARYIGTWYQGMLFAIVALILSELNLSDYFDPDTNGNNSVEAVSTKRKVSLFLLAFIGITTLSSVHNYMMMLGVSNTQGSGVREPFIPIVETIKKAQMPDQSKVYIIAQHTIGFEYFVLRYEMAGMKFGQVPWSIGSTYGDGDMWTDPTWDVNKWSNTLRGYDYVVLYRTTESFNNEFGSLFKSGVIDSESVYKVVNNGAKVSLTKVG